MDQALEPVLAEELKVNDNGHVVFRMGETVEKFKLNTDLDRAKRELRKLDSTVQKHLIKLTRGQRTVYFLAGHGEANWRETENDFRKINLYKRELLEGTMSLKVKTFGVADGSTTQVPDDADVVVVAGPTEPLLDEEVQTLAKFYDGGGSLLVMIDPEGDSPGGSAGPPGHGARGGGAGQRRGPRPDPGGPGRPGVHRHQQVRQPRRRQAAVPQQPGRPHGVPHRDGRHQEGGHRQQGDHPDPLAAQHLGGRQRQLQRRIPTRPRRCSSWPPP